MIFPNTARDMICHVVIIATGLDKTSGTIYAYVRRDSDGYFLKADNTWVNGAPTGADLPTATYVAQGAWKLRLSAAVTNALTVGESVTCRMTDNETPASATVTSDISEHTVDASVAAVPDAVWDEATSGHSAAGSTGLALTTAAAISPPTVGAIADAVWDEAIAGHAAAGSTGAALTAAGAGGDPAAIADAVWDEALAGHLTTGTAGKAIYYMLLQLAQLEAGVKGGPAVTS